MGRIGKAIRDKRLFGLIGKLLRSGAMVEGIVITSADVLDKEPDERGHSYCRYADDCNILREQSGSGGTDAGLDSGLD